VKRGNVAEGVGAEVGRAEQQIGRAVTVEVEAAFALGIETDQCQCRVGHVRSHHIGGADAGALQAVEQEVAETVAPEHAGETRIATEPCRGDRHVSRCAAGERHEAGGKAVGVGCLCMQIDQRFAEAKDGVGSHFRGLRVRQRSAGGEGVRGAGDKRRYSGWMVVQASGRRRRSSSVSRV
jgi:hypothetical protein